MQKQQHVVSFFAARDPTHNHTSYVYIEASAVPAARTRPRSSSTIQATFFRRRRVIDLSSRINPIMFAMSRWHLPLPRTSTLLVASDAPKARRLGAILDGVGCSRRSALLLFPCQTCVSLCCCMWSFAPLPCSYLAHVFSRVRVTNSRDSNCHILCVPNESIPSWHVLAPGLQSGPSCIPGKETRLRFVAVATCFPMFNIVVPWEIKQISRQTYEWVYTFIRRISSTRTSLINSLVHQATLFVPM